MNRLNEYSLEKIPNSALEKVFIDGVCLGVIETSSNVNVGYHAHMGKYSDLNIRGVPFDMRSVYGFIAPIDAANYLYKIYLSFIK